MKSFLIAGNWKMNMLREATRNLIDGINTGLEGLNLDNVQILICPTFTSLGLAQKLTNNSPLSLGAQNMHFEEKGAYTGEISPKMLIDSGCEYVILGHSERRQYFGEDNELLTKKIASAFVNNLIPVFCIGETLQERENNVTFKVLEYQLSLLSDFTTDELKTLVIAYEPIWAIGTGLTASEEQIYEVHSWIANYLQNKFGVTIKILYGGSLNEKNAKEILSTEFVSGGLIGGASLDAEKFLSIIQTAISIK
ncbi:MAG: triose-phosphate isomerase [Ignavibacteria bacterium GWF2_33_9]|nr:MAG: triose-phosphate isomerase [Ignavibacteria bacterium GWF2_33_9]